MTQVALQTFTVRKYLKSPAAIENGFARVKDLGLNAIELAYIKLQQAEMDAVERASRTHGITVGSSQITYKILNEERDWMLQLHDQLGCNITSVSVLPIRVIWGKRDRMLRFAEQLETLGKFYKENGIQLCFHHHDFEFRHYGDDIGLDLLLANTSSENVGLELDTYWVARGGRAAHDVINDLNGRVKVVHLRDYRMQQKLFGLSSKDCALGQGTLDIQRIVDSCVANQVQYMAIEQNTADPFAEVATSVSHLQKLGYGNLF